MQLIHAILYDMIYHSAPIVLCVIGGVFAYKANVLNIALEGMMLIGALLSTVVAFYTGNLMLGLVAALVGSLCLGLIFSVVSVTLRGNVIIVGLACNLLASAIAAFVLVEMNTNNITLSFLNVADLQLNIPGLEAVPVLGPLLSGHPILTYVAASGVALTSLLMYKTKFGLYVRVVGENDDAAASIGIKASWYRYGAIVLGALCCALAGVNLSTERLGLFTNNMTAGRGFIAIAAIYCGRGDPCKSSLYALLFGFARSLSINLAPFAGPASGLFDVIPYLLMIGVLTVVSIASRRHIQERGFAHD